MDMSNKHAWICRFSLSAMQTTLNIVLMKLFEHVRRDDYLKTRYWKLFLFKLI